MRRKHLAILCAGFIVTLGGNMLPSTAATPSSGTIGVEQPGPIGWTGPVATSSSYGVGCATAYCDVFSLSVSTPSDYWLTHEGGARVEVSWTNPNDYFEIFVYDKSGAQVASDGDNPFTDRGATSGQTLVPDASAERSPYTIEVVYRRVVNSSYAGSAAFVTNDGGVKGDGAIFDMSNPLEFAPTTTVSAHFLGAEPQITMERSIPGAPAGVTDPRRIFIDYPLSFRAQIGQLNRSLDGGDSFRLLFDPACAGRSRPTCQTGGGGDSDNDVNLHNGTLFFADQEGGVAQESIASSADHGDTFPPARQWAVTNTTTASDRQWVAAADDGSIAVGPRRIHAFLSYARATNGIFIQGIDQDGLPIPQPKAQIETLVGVPGRIEVDTTRGPGDGWVYLAYPLGEIPGSDQKKGIYIATAPGGDYVDPRAWSSSRISPDLPDTFVWPALDNAGNAYATWNEGGVAYYAFSRISDPANNPKMGGRPGTSWSKQYRISLPNLGSTVFAAATAGDEGRVGITFMGTEDFRGKSSEAPDDARWHTYATVIENALADRGAPVVHTGKVSHRVVHTGNIDGSDQSLLDLIDLDHDQDGRLGVVFMDNHSTFAEVGPTLEDPAFRDSRAKPFTQFAKQTSGPSLSAAAPQVSVSIPRDERADPAGDATWPNTSSGRYLPSMDALGASLGLEGDQIVARVPLPPGSLDVVGQDLTSFNATPSGTQPAARIQYVVRFSDHEDVFHLSGDVTGTGQWRGLGGRLDLNDANAETGTVAMASYRGDTFYPVTTAIEEGALVLRGSAAALGLHEGIELLGVSAFVMAGPAEQNETFFTPMRTVDATPPFDTTLGLSPAPSPSVSATPTQDPTPVPDPTLSPTPPPSDGDCDILGTPGNDYLSGTEGDDTICGLGGDDVLLAGAGDDTLLGGPGDDRLFGQTGQDLLKGGRGSDELRGGEDRDILLGRQDHDDLYGEAHDDFLRGGRGRDRCRGGAGRNHLRGCERP